MLVHSAPNHSDDSEAVGASDDATDVAFGANEADADLDLAVFKRAEARGAGYG